MILMMAIDSLEPAKARKVELLYEKYNGLMFAAAYKILGQKEDAEDAVFESWERIIKNIEKINEIDCKETRSFIVIITERISIDLYRKKGRRREIAVDNLEDHPFVLTNDREIMQAEDIAWIRSIPKKYSEALILHYVNGYSMKEIAGLLGIKEGSVASRISRGRKMLEKGVKG